MQFSVQQKSNFYKDDVDVDKILLSNKILFGGKGFKVLLLTKIMKKYICNEWICKKFW